MGGLPASVHSSLFAARVPWLREDSFRVTARCPFSRRRSEPGLLDLPCSPFSQTPWVSPDSSLWVRGNTAVLLQLEGTLCLRVLPFGFLFRLLPLLPQRVLGLGWKWPRFSKGG